MKAMTDDCAQEGAAGRRKASAEARLLPPGGAIPRPSCDPVTVGDESGGLEAVPGEGVSAVSAAPGARQAGRRIARRRKAGAA